MEESAKQEAITADDASWECVACTKLNLSCELICLQCGRPRKPIHERPVSLQGGCQPELEIPKAAMLQPVFASGSRSSANTTASTIQLLPESAQVACANPEPKPATKLQGAALQANIKAALEGLEPAIQGFINQGLCCMLLLFLLQTMRAASWFEELRPSPGNISLHCLSSFSDISSILCAAPFFTTGARGRCVSKACLGPMLTMIFSMSVVDITGIVAYFVVNPHRPIAPGYVSLINRLMAAASAWEVAFFASVALQIALLTTSWRIYRDMRLAGIYPPGNGSLVKGEKLNYVSFLEVVCEAEDVALLDECKVCNGATTAGEIVIDQLRTPRDGRDLAPAVSLSERASNLAQVSK